MPAAFAGFDTSVYPGDHAMGVWKDSSPYVFVAYYLQAPCHHSGSWMGRRATLVDLGWNLLPVYVGQQVAGASPCTSSVLTSAQGETDAEDAGSIMTSEGFPAGSFVYLDVERAEILPAGMTAYIAAWVSALASGDFSPGIYCHKHNASAVRAAVPRGISPRFWIVGGVVSRFNIITSKPADVGITFADLWQCPVSVHRTFAGATINIDENIATNEDPASAPATQTEPRP
jgi:Domain of unknown function (DUF1906)